MKNVTHDDDDDDNEDEENGDDDGDDNDEWWTWMKKSLGFPASVGHRSAVNGCQTFIIIIIHIILLQMIIYDVALCAG